MLTSRQLESPPLGAPARNRNLAELIEDHPRGMLAIYTIIYVCGYWASASQTPFWFDEIFTYRIAQLPHISDIWNVISRGIELNPPGFFWFTWLLARLFGMGHIVTRIPAALGYWVMSLCLYSFVRRRTRTAYAVIALLFPLSTFAADWIVEARGYGLELGCAAIALLCWQRATEETPRLLALSGLALGLMGAVSCHYYAAYAIFVLLAAELLRSCMRRTVDLPCFTAIILGFLPLLLFHSLFGAVAAGAKAFWASPRVDILSRTYGSILVPALFWALPLLAFMLARKPPTERQRHARNEFPLWEILAATLLAAMPFLVFVAGFRFHVGLWGKYVILAVPGFAILVSAAFYRLAAGEIRAVDFALKSAFWICFLPWLIWTAHSVATSPSPSDFVRSNAILPEAATKPIVMTDDVDFLQYDFYLPPEQKKQLCVLINLPAARKYAGYDTGARSLDEGRRWWPIRAYDYKEFVARNPEFILVRSARPDWIAQQLLEDGADLRLLRIHRAPGILESEIQMFAVKIARDSERTSIPAFDQHRPPRAASLFPDPKQSTEMAIADAR